MRLTKREPVRKGIKQANGQQSELSAIRGHHRRHPSGAPLRSAHIVNNKEDHSQHFKAPQASPTLSYSMDLHRCDQGLAHLSSTEVFVREADFCTLSCGEATARPVTQGAAPKIWSRMRKQK